MKMFKEYPDVVEVDDMCHMLCISKKTAYKLLKENRINYKRVGRAYKIPKANVVKFMTEKM